MSRTSTAFLFDLDGTLVDSVYQHVLAWKEALDREGVCHVPAALAGTTFHIGRFSGEPIVIEEWDGQSFELP